MSRFTDRMIRAARLDVTLYEEVEADRGAMTQAMGVVALSSLAAGVGYRGITSVTALLVSILASLTGWFIWAYITYFVGTKIFPEPQTHTDHGKLLRTISFSSSPGILRIFGIVPVIRGVVNLIVMVWMLTAMVVAVRQALDYTSTLRAVTVCFAGWVVQAALIVLVDMVF
ncbi:hypothetical protein LLG96_07045 [bacterium]|nr:hypothetical protein [bacterium]